MSAGMTPRERILAAIRREPVDHVPCCGFFNPLSPQQRRGRTWNFPWSPDTPGDEQLRYQVEELGLDQVVSVGVRTTRSSPDVRSEAWIEGEVLHKRIDTPAGPLHAAVRHNDMWPHGQDIPFYSDFNVGHYVEPWIKTSEDLECLKQIQMPLTVEESIDASREAFAASKALADKYCLATRGGAGMGLTGAQHLFGVRELCMMTIDDPDLVDAYLEHEHAINLIGIRALGELGTDIISRNGFYETADFYGPTTLDRFLTRRLCAEADEARAFGMLTAYTAHTGVMPILDYLDGLTVESLVGVDIAFEGVDMYELRDRLSGTKAFWTGPSSTYHIWKGPEPTRQAVRDVMECFGKTGLILSQCVSSHSIMPWESTLAMIDEWRKLR